MRPGISERTFEFCYNAEFCRRHHALLATHPHLPTQNAERDLGYDVEFEIQHRNFTRSIFIQHKVAHYAAARAGRNASFYNAHGGPYFRFSVDNDQHNTLVDLARSHGNAYYCAPRFHTRHEMEEHFWGDAVARHSLLLNPLQVGEITDNDRHNITFGPPGYPKILHSEPKRFGDERFGGEELPPLERVDVSEAYVEYLGSRLIEITSDSKFKKKLPPRIERLRPVKQTQFILSRIYDVSWFLLP